MAQIIALGQPVQVHCATCGRHTWQVSVMLGKQKLRCPFCTFATIVTFYEERSLGGRMVFKMKVRMPAFSW